MAASATRRRSSSPPGSAAASGRLTHGIPPDRERVSARLSRRPPKVILRTAQAPLDGRGARRGSFVPCHAQLDHAIVDELEAISAGAEIEPVGRAVHARARDHRKREVGSVTHSSLLLKWWNCPVVCAAWRHKGSETSARLGSERARRRVGRLLACGAGYRFPFGGNAVTTLPAPMVPDDSDAGSSLEVEMNPPGSRRDSTRHLSGSVPGIASRLHDASSRRSVRQRIAATTTWRRRPSPILRRASTASRVEAPHNPGACQGCSPLRRCRLASRLPGGGMRAGRQTARRRPRGAPKTCARVRARAGDPPRSERASTRRPRRRPCPNCRADAQRCDRHGRAATRHPAPLQPDPGVRVEGAKRVGAVLVAANGPAHRVDHDHDVMARPALLDPVHQPYQGIGSRGCVRGGSTGHSA